jgi:murein DD-endopeptidase MepM/ murein hydrolase activator NlpD
MRSLALASLALLALAASGCNGAPARGPEISARPPAVRSDPALEAGLKSLEEPRSFRHTVAKGDTLYGLARKYGMPVAAICAANPGLSAATLRVGAQVIIPGTAAAGTVEPVQKTPAAPGPKPPRTGTPDRGRLRHPAAGAFRASQGAVPGAEFAVPAGSAVVAADRGTVVMATQELGGLGPTVMVDHGGGLVTMYARLADYAVKPGQTLARGEPLGRVGAVGLLFRVYEGPAAKGPGPYLDAK